MQGFAADDESLIVVREAGSAQSYVVVTPQADDDANAAADFDCDVRAEAFDALFAPQSTDEDTARHI